MIALFLLVVIVIVPYTYESIQRENLIAPYLSAKVESQSYKDAAIAAEKKEPILIPDKSGYIYEDNGRTLYINLNEGKIIIMASHKNVDNDVSFFHKALVGPYTVTGSVINVMYRGGYADLLPLARRIVVHSIDVNQLVISNFIEMDDQALVFRSANKNDNAERSVGE